ncbi:MAG: hypothetical protein KDM63_15640 [Verrucomicrobiae bacterium]|nr:hypothetical protein [Verrucomicrobiae bacterium]MCB1088470.1 hypothetical protein [Verrucomicrobiae bacterium]
MRLSEAAIPAAAFLFEEANGNPVGEFEVAEMIRHGLSGQDPGRIAEALVKAVADEGGTEAGYRRQAYWALGKRFDPGLIPFFRRQLAVELSLDLNAAYQIMIALDNLNEPVFSGPRSSQSVEEEDRNRSDAETYLSCLF